MRTLRWLALGLIFAASGCGRGDAERLSRAGSKLGEKLRALAPDRVPFGTWNGASMDSSTEERVRARIKSDHFLAPLNIEVIADDGGVRLRGQVADDVLKRRAIEMAQSTVGVAKVVDELE